MGKVILGGGLGGLSAAYYLIKKVPKRPVTVIESTSRTGGWIKSYLQKDGIVFEQGPRTIRPQGEAGANTLELVEELNLDDQIVAITSKHPAAKNRLIYAKGSLYSLPSSLADLFTKQEFLSKPIISYLLHDLIADKKQLDDEPIYDFVERRFGKEVADYVISPMVCGICAGSAQEVSVNFLMQKFFQYEQKYGSVTNGILRNLIQWKKSSDSDLVAKARKEKWSIYSFNNGCETLPLTLRDTVINHGVRIRLNTKCESISFVKDGVILHLNDNDAITTDHLISAIPSSVLGRLIEKQHPQLAESLKKLVKNVSVAVVNLQFKQSVLKDQAFGLLVAPKEKLPILGIIYDSCCFPSSKNCSTRLTVMMGGHWFKLHFGNAPTEKDLLDAALKGVKQILKISEDPETYKVNILHQCLPQYIVGHNRHLNDISTYIKKRFLPISLCGACYNGVGINDVILSAKRAVDELS